MVALFLSTSPVRHGVGTLYGIAFIGNPQADREMDPGAKLVEPGMDISNPGKILSPDPGV